MTGLKLLYTRAEGGAMAVTREGVVSGVYLGRVGARRWACTVPLSPAAVPSSQGSSIWRGEGREGEGGKRGRGEGER